MATQHAAGFSTTDSEYTLSSICNTLAKLEREILDAGGTVDWTTVQVVKKNLSTGWPQMPSVAAYGVLLSTT